MREIVFSMELKGKAEPLVGKENAFKALLIGTDFWGERVTFESQVILHGDTFNETGYINYQRHGKLKFETVGVGHLGPSPVPGLQWGSVIWSISQGEGELADAKGYITSNFTLSAEGDVVDNQCIRIFTPH